MRNSLKMDVLDELRLFREKRLSNSTFCTPVSYSNLNMNLNLKLESETIERIVVICCIFPGGLNYQEEPVRRLLFCLFIEIMKLLILLIDIATFMA